MGLLESGGCGRPIKRTTVRFYSDRAETCPTTSLCRVHDLLPMFDQPPRERSDAARNREALLAAAARLVEDHGVDAVTMDSVAAAAGVGKGTVFRRFDSREGLMAALLNRSETEWQGLVIERTAPARPGRAGHRAAARVRPLADGGQPPARRADPGGGPRGRAFVRRRLVRRHAHALPAEPARRPRRPLLPGHRPARPARDGGARPADPRRGDPARPHPGRLGRPRPPRGVQRGQPPAG